jgi:hypothetical protein
MIEVRFNGPCVFCGQMIEDSRVDPCRVTVETQEGLAQVWFCHAQCFKQRVAENQYVDLSPAHF